MSALCRAGPADGRDMVLRREIRAIDQKRGKTVRIEFWGVPNPAAAEAFLLLSFRLDLASHRL